MPTTCPYCAEAIPPAAAKCPHCGEPMGGGAAPPPPARGSRAALIAIVAGVCVFGMICFIGMVAAIALPNLIEARKHGNEAVAIGSLKTVSTAQVVFREGDKDRDGVRNYAADLAALGDTSLIDPVLGTGVKQGYAFELVGTDDAWMALASPVAPGTTGDRYFVTNHEGIVYYAFTPLHFTADLSIPPEATPIGR
ncbi:MAG: hypothetical protein KIT68_13660 [Phycisphaeraceae bacterium]|nr:hypothetical protein [Phycisphaeraceae bacterium]